MVITEWWNFHSIFKLEHILAAENMGVSVVLICFQRWPRSIVNKAILASEHLLMIGKVIEGVNADFLDKLWMIHLNHRRTHAKEANDFAGVMD